MQRTRAVRLFVSLALLSLGGAAYGGAPGATSPEMGRAPPSAAGPSAPERGPDAPIIRLRTIQKEPVRAHATDVVDYRLHASLDPVAHTVHGEGTIRWRNRSGAPANELWLHLYLNAFKNERSVFLRERVGGRGSLRPEEWGWIDVRKLVLRGPAGSETDLWPAAERSRPDDPDETEARVPLPEPVAPGQEITLEVAFDDRLPAVVERTGHAGSFHMVGQWFPKIARLEPDGRWAHFPFHHLAEFYADFGAYDVTLDVPETFTIAATGPATESRIDAGRRIERHVQEDIHDFAWAAWDRFASAKERIDGVDVTVFYPPGCAPLAERELTAIRFALPDHSAHYGPYPYPLLTVVHPPESASEAGGMEYPTLITSGGPCWVPSGVRSSEVVTVHELGHQWFYGMIATDEVTWPVLDEGLNQFAEIDAMGRWLGAGSLVDLAGLQISDAATQALGGGLAVHDEPVAQPAFDFSTGANYGDLVYARTASVVATLARVYGEERVAAALGLYARRQRFEHPGPEALFSA
ncbi:MAG: M1 family metallopeptidase, partial [Myxococcales bacterium]|nr:M1 family metallopeptidase [Myxococcales bacterium]